MGDKKIKLKYEHQLFCEHYIYYHNGSKAYQLVYKDVSPSVARANASRLLANANVKEYIEQLKEERRQRMVVERDDLIEKAFNVYFSAMTPRKIRKWNPELKEMEETGETYTDNAGANNALRNIMTMTGLDKPPVDTSVDDEINDAFDIVVNVKRSTPKKQEEQLEVDDTDAND